MLHLKVSVCIILFAAAVINSAPVNNTDENRKPVTLLKYTNELKVSGEYKFEYKTSDDQERQEIGKLVKNQDGVESLYVIGSYSFVGPDGVLYSVFYTADEFGFRATGNHIPGKENEKPIPQFDPNAFISLVGG